jgi:hypothetical protein
MDDWEIGVVKKESWEEENDQSEEDVKDSWDAEEEPEEKPKQIPLPKKKEIKPPPQVARELTKDERDKEVKAADLEQAMELFGIKGVDAREAVGAVKDKTQQAPPTPLPDVISLGAKDPVSIPEFESLAKKLALHLNQKFSTNQHYPMFLETLIRQIMTERDAPEVRKVSSILNELANSKAKKPAAKKKATLTASHKKGDGIDFEDYGDAYDDFE